MRTLHARAPRLPRGWWGKIGVLGVGLVLPGGLVLLLYWAMRSRPRAASAPTDPYVGWLRELDEHRRERRRPTAVEGTTWRWQGQYGPGDSSGLIPAATVPEDGRRGRR
jgi:hypothetical protein